MTRDFVGSLSTRKVFLIRTVIWLSLFHYYTTFSGFLAYCFIALKKLKISSVDFLFLLGLALLMVFHLAIKTPSDVVLDFRYYWGWVFFYIIFKGNILNHKVSTSVLVLLCVLTLVEALLVNTVTNVQMLPNFPGGLNSNIASPGEYQRPYSFAGMPQVGAPLLVSLMALCNVRGWRLWLSILAVLSLASGTGVLALTVLLLVRYRAEIRKAALPFSLFLLLTTLFFYKEILFVFDMFADKTNPGYLIYLTDLLWSNIVDVYEKAEMSAFFIGFSSEDGTGVSGHGGDWGYLSFFEHNGILGILLFLSLIGSRVNRANGLPLFIVLSASIHYATMSFLPGQMILGWLLSINKGGLPGEPKHTTTA